MHQGVYIIMQCKLFKDDVDTNKYSLNFEVVEYKSN